VTIEEYAPTRSASGAEKRAWIDYLTRWAGVAFRSGKEFTGARQVYSEAEVVFILRAPLEAKPTMRVLLNGEAFDVIAVDSYSDPDRVRLICKGGVRIGN
jgi:SPP1 family predicted phage head-tail adaptor